MRTSGLAIVVLLLLAWNAAAQTVTPSQRVVNDVDVRVAPSVYSKSIATLGTGDVAALIERVPRWYKVRLNDGREGYVTKSWTTVLPASAPLTAGISPKQSDEIRISFFNTGAGSCTIVECPGDNARPIVVDCGSFPNSRDENALSDDAAKARFSAILSKYPAPDLVLSHGDSDHYNLIPTVLDGFTVNEIWQGDALKEYGSDLRKWIDDQVAAGAKRRNNFPVGWHNNGERIKDGLQCGAASASVLTVNTGGSKNANSLVLMVEHNDFSAIFTGDAEGTTEASAIFNYASNIKTTVLTGSHHGADTHGSNSNPWAEATRPEVIVYSAGTKYGHPRCAAKDRLALQLATTPAHNAICGVTNDSFKRYTSKRAEYMTRVNGTITVTTDGKSPLRLQCEMGPGCDTQIPY